MANANNSIWIVCGESICKCPGVFGQSTFGSSCSRSVEDIGQLARLTIGLASSLR